MSTEKLERNGKVIERLKSDYEANISRYELRGFKIASNKPVQEKKPEPVAENPQDQTVVNEELSSEWKEEKPKETTKKKAK